jgi:predicted oxidoreductase
VERAATPLLSPPVAPKKITAKEFALSRSEQNPDLTNKEILMLLSRSRQTP